MRGISAFDGRTPDGVSLADDLHARRIEHLYVGGLATDFCVRETVLDARRAGVHVTVLKDAVAGIDVHPGDSDRAFADMRDAGAEFTTSTEWPFAVRPTTSLK